MVFNMFLEYEESMLCGLGGGGIRGGASLINGGALQGQRIGRYMPM
jgi:hypothetical protein